MYLAKVFDNVWSTKKVDNLIGYKFLIVRPLNRHLEETLSAKVVIDTLGAGIGDYVVCVGGSAARRWLGSNDKSFEGAVIAIVDKIDINKELVNIDSYER